MTNIRRKGVKLLSVKMADVDVVQISVRDYPKLGRWKIHPGTVSNYEKIFLHSSGKRPKWRCYVQVQMQLVRIMRTTKNYYKRENIISNGYYTSRWHLHFVIKTNLKLNKEKFVKGK